MGKLKDKWEVLKKGPSIKRFCLQVKSFACTTQQPLCPGGDRETGQGHTTRPKQCVRQRPAIPCASLAANGIAWKTQLSPGAERHPSLKACSQKPHLCPTGV